MKRNVSIAEERYEELLPPHLSPDISPGAGSGRRESSSCWCLYAAWSGEHFWFEYHHFYAWVKVYDALKMHFLGTILIFWGCALIFLNIFEDKDRSFKVFTRLFIVYWTINRRFHGKSLMVCYLSTELWDIWKRK